MLSYYLRIQVNFASFFPTLKHKLIQRPDSQVIQNFKLVVELKL